MGKTASGNLVLNVHHWNNFDCSRKRAGVLEGISPLLYNFDLCVFENVGTRLRTSQKWPLECTFSVSGPWPISLGDVTMISRHGGFAVCINLPESKLDTRAVATKKDGEVILAARLC